MNNVKAMRTLQYCASKEGYDLEFDKFSEISDTIMENKSTKIGRAHV